MRQVLIAKSSTWTAIESIYSKKGGTQLINEWVHKHEFDSSMCGDVTSAQDRIKKHECENEDLRHANEILKVARAFFA